MELIGPLDDFFSTHPIGQRSWQLRSGGCWSATGRRKGSLTVGAGMLKHPGGRFSARVFSLFFLDTPGMGSSFSVVFAMFFLVHVLFWCLKCCHLQWLPNVTIF